MTSNISNYKTANNNSGSIMERRETVFVVVKPEGFIIDGMYTDSLNFVVKQESLARKFWDRYRAGESNLSCSSRNGLLSVNGKNCNTCENNWFCMLKLRVFFKQENTHYCLELPKSSYKNYRSYTTELLKKGLNVRCVTTSANVVDKGYWGEVVFKTAGNIT